MYSTKILAGMALTTVAILPGGSFSDEIADDVVNGYFASYDILQNHPECDQPGMIAHRVKFDAQNVAAVISHKDEKYFTTQLTAGITTYNRSCSTVVRRGTEHSIAKYPCYDETQNTDQRVLLEPQKMDLSFSAEMTTCQSFGTFDLLDGSWTSTLSIGPDSIEHTGTFLTSKSEGCHDPKPAPRTFATVHLHRAGDLERQFINQVRNSSVPAVFSLHLGGIPVPVIGSEEPEFDVSTKALFFPTHDGRADCPDGVCRASDHPGHYFFWRPTTCD